jgi:hypothetical protein
VAQAGVRDVRALNYILQYMQFPIRCLMGVSVGGAQAGARDVRALNNIKQPVLPYPLYDGGLCGGRKQMSE